MKEQFLFYYLIRNYLILQNSIENNSSLKYGMESKFLIIAAQNSFIEGKNSVILLTGENNS